MFIFTTQEHDCNIRVDSSFQTKNSIPKGISNFFQSSSSHVTPTEAVEVTNLIPLISAASSSSARRSKDYDDVGVVSKKELEVVHDFVKTTAKCDKRFLIDRTENKIEKNIKDEKEKILHSRSQRLNESDRNLDGCADDGSDDDFKIIINDNNNLRENNIKNRKNNNCQEKADEVEVEVMKRSRDTLLIPPSSSSASSTSSSIKVCTKPESELSSCHCPICNLNISLFSESRRTFHVNGCCIDSSTLSSSLTNASTPKKQSKTSLYEKNKPPSDSKKIKLKAEEGKGEGMKKGRIDNYFYASPT